MPATGRATKPLCVSASARRLTRWRDEQRRREYQSLFADNVALSRRPADRSRMVNAGHRSAASSPAAPSTVARTRAASATAQQESGDRSGATKADPDGPADAFERAASDAVGSRRSAGPQRRARNAVDAQGDRPHSRRSRHASACSKARSSKPSCSTGSMARSPARWSAWSRHRSIRMTGSPC